MKDTAKIYTDQELIERRLAGVLPRIDIAGEAFIIDWRLRELRSEQDPQIRINLGHLPVDDNGDNYLCFYNTKHRTEDPPNPEMTRLPENVVLLTIPNELKLDPVALSREYGMGDTGLLADFPIQRDLKATVTPLDRTELVWLVNRNIEKKRHLNESLRTHRKAMNKGKSKGKNKGKGI